MPWIKHYDHEKRFVLGLIRHERGERKIGLIFLCKDNDDDGMKTEEVKLDDQRRDLIKQQ